MDTDIITRAGAYPAGQRSRDKWSVLVVDDSRQVREMLKAVLSGDGVFGSIHEASGGHEALDVLDEVDGVDLIIMDIKMPGMDGFELIGRLKSSEGYSDIPVLILSVDGRGEIKTMGLNVGASDYVVKPFD
jgi:CheY-like chemotaxis protein